VFTTWDGKPRSIYYTGAEKWAQVADPSEAAEAAKTKLVFSGVQKIDIENKTVHLASGKTVRYGKLLIATGGTPKALEGAPANDNIKTFRTVADFKRLRAAVSKDSRVVVIGGGFLGSELTMAMTKHAGTVTQVFPEKVCDESRW
jgi:programmed cell death 8 (apoptosis-inducing factor)